MRWNTPVEGLVVGVRAQRKAPRRRRRLGLPNREKSARPDTTTHFYQYAIGNRAPTRNTAFLPRSPYSQLHSEDVADVNAWWYIAGSYRVIKQLEPALTTALHDHLDVPGLRDTSLPSGHDYDKAVTANRPLSFPEREAEGHFMDGYGFGPH